MTMHHHYGHGNRDDCTPVYQNPASRPFFYGFVMVLTVGIAAVVVGSFLAAATFIASIVLILVGVALILASVLVLTCGQARAAANPMPLPGAAMPATAFASANAARAAQEAAWERALLEGQANAANSNNVQAGMLIWRDANGNLVMQAPGASTPFLTVNRGVNRGGAAAAGSVVTVNGVTYVVGGGPPVAVPAGAGPGAPPIPYAVPVQVVPPVSVKVRGARAHHAAGAPGLGMGGSGPIMVDAARPAGSVVPPPPAVGAPDFAAREQREIEAEVDKANTDLDAAIAKAGDFDFAFDKGYEEGKGKEVAMQ